jgi:hypothetical protein
VNRTGGESLYLFDGEIEFISGMKKTMFILKKSDFGGCKNKQPIKYKLGISINVYTQQYLQCDC